MLLMFCDWLIDYYYFSWTSLSMLLLLWTFTGLSYLLIFSFILRLFFFFYRIKPALGIIYLALKICLLLLLEAGIFPLLCGWWIDICAFVSTTIKLMMYSRTWPSTMMAIILQVILLFSMLHLNEKWFYHNKPATIDIINCLL